MAKTDTIAAISTPFGEGGIGIIRISGDNALPVGLKVFSFAGPLRGGPGEKRLYYGRLTDEDGRTVDNGFFVYMKGPVSYTGADTVELHLHGGALILKKSLELVLRNGARLAGPGEFTRQAFLNGKLDLAQAESVIDVIRAETESSLAAARGGLEGLFSKKVNGIKERILNLMTHLEAELDFEEDEIEGLSKEKILKELIAVRGLLKKLIDTYEEGRALRDGVRVLILGRPNVGKSSLLNVLLKEERAIVTDVPGTTRDIIEETVNIRGIPVRLMDTAGLRETSDRVESVGVMAARKKIDAAGLILFVVDVNSFTGEDLELVNSLDGKKLLVAANKSDIADGPVLDKARRYFNGYKTVFISALADSGIEELKDAIYEEAVGHAYGRNAGFPGELVVSARHRDSLTKALEGIERAEDAFAQGLPREFSATDLRWSLDRLGEITGETTTEDILESIFSNFCIGK